MALLKFLKGNYAGLSAKAITEGQVLICGDTGEMFVDVAADKRVKIGDFSVVADIAALEALDATAVPTSRLYYVEDGNILARSNGTGWTQINKQKTLAELGGVSATTYVTDKAALVKADTDNATAISDLETYVGTIPADATAQNIVAYVQERTSGIATDTALEELTGRVDVAEGKLTTLTGADTVEGSVAKALKDAKAYTDKKDTAMDIRMDAVEGSVTTLTGEEGVTGSVKAIAKSYADSKDAAIAAAKKAGDDAQADVDALEAKVGTVADGKTVVGLISEAKTQADKGVTDAATAQAGVDAIAADYLKASDKTELQGNIDKKVDKTTYDAKVATLESADTTLQGNIDAEAQARKDADDAQVARIATLEGQITGLSGAMHFEGVKAEVPADVSGYEAGDVIIVGEKEYVFNGTAFVEFGDVSAEGERIAALETTVGKAAEGENPATGLIKDIANNAAAITAEKTRAEGVEANLAQADIDNLQAAKDYADKKIADLGIGDYAKQADLDTHTDNTDIHITAAERTKWNAAEGKAHTHTNKALLDTYTQTEENLADAVAKKHSHANAEELAKIEAGDKAKWDAVVADHLVAADKTELEGKITAAQTAAEGKVTELANGAVKANTDAIATINGTGDGSFAKADATLKTNLEAYADQAESDAVATAKAYTDSLLEWGSF